MGWADSCESGCRCCRRTVVVVIVVVVLVLAEAKTPFAFLACCFFSASCSFCPAAVVASAPTDLRGRDTAKGQRGLLERVRTARHDAIVFQSYYTLLPLN